MSDKPGGAIYFQKYATLVSMTKRIKGKEFDFELNLCCARGAASSMYSMAVE